MHKIVLEEITIKAHIGVTSKERKRRQRMSVSVELYPTIEPNGINDTIERAVNYSSVRQDVIRLLNTGTYKLIETAALQIAEQVRKQYNVKSVRVTVRKYPYRDTNAVSYTLEM
jgi:dihydroneopterin aldolase